MLPGFNEEMAVHLRSDIKDANNKYPIQAAIEVIDSNVKKLGAQAKVEVFKQAGFKPEDFINIPNSSSNNSIDAQRTKSPSFFHIFTR